MGSEETRTEGERKGSSETGKVVRIPRDWFGPKDDLVPFGPRATEGLDGVETSSNDEPATPLDASLFWGEDAGSVQHVVEAKSGASTTRRPIPGRSLALAALIVVIAASGLAASLLTGPGRPAKRPHVAAVTERPQATSRRHPLARVEAESVRRPAIRRVQTKSTHKAARPKPPIQVTYHANQVQPVTSAVYTAPQPSSNKAVGSSTPAAPDRASAQSAASTSGSSQPAFGANGALGPMSSPNG